MKTIRRISKAIGNIVPENLKIGGKNVVVEIDESKFGKRKYNKGHKVDGVWVVGMVERSERRKLSLIPVEKRDRTTLNNLIKSYVKEGSIIYTDCWRGYDDIKHLGYIHHTVNHSNHFKDPNSGVHTNTIEGTWSAVKKTIPSRSRSKNSVSKYLNLFMFCRVYYNTRLRMIIRYLLNSLKF